MTVPFALTHATLVHGDASGTTAAQQTVVVDGSGIITQVGASVDVAVPSGYRIIDVSGKYVVPGLINAHAHLFSDGKPLPAALTSEKAEKIVASFFHGPIGRRIAAARAHKNAMTQLHSGVTTLRSLGDVGYEVVALREQVNTGTAAGPRILAAGPMIAATGGHGAPLVSMQGDGPWQMRANVRKNLRAGVSALKIAATGGVTDARTIGEAGRPQMTEEEMEAICHEAHTAGIIVAAHAQSTEGMLRALRAGVDTIEHGATMNTEIIDLFHDNPKSLRGYSALVPTLNAGLPLVKLDRSITGVTDVVRANSEIVVSQMLDAVADARTHGITIGIGTDSAMTYVTQYNTWRELDYVVRYGGLTAAEALHAATETNAKILGFAGETGSIAEGMCADLAVLRSHPLESFRAFIDPEMVIACGHILHHPRVERFPEIEDQLDSF